MGVKLPTDPTFSNPQDPEDAAQPHAGAGGDRDFEPYVRRWERLAAALNRVTAAGRSKEMAQTDLGRAIADRIVDIRCQLKRHESGIMTSKEILEGKDFNIPPEIKPKDLNWETSRPVKRWLVRRGHYSLSGYWDLDWIDVCRADVTKVLCTAKEQASAENAAIETPGPLTLKRPEAVGPGHRSTAELQKPGPGGLARPRGRRPQKLEQTKTAMRNDIQQGQLTVSELANAKETYLETKYAVSRDTARKARQAVLSEI